MKKGILFGLAITAAMAAALSAHAADLPILKSSPQIGYPTRCGAFYGLSVLGGGAPIKNAPVGATELQGAAGIVAGYTCPIAGSFWFVEGGAYVQNLNGSQNGLSFSGPFKLTQTAAFGVDGILQVAQGLAPFNASALPALPSLPLLPAGITAGPAHSYMHLTLTEEDVSAQIGAASNRAWLVRGGGGLGMLTRLSNNAVVDTRVTGYFQSSELCLGGLGCPKLGAGFEVSTSIKW